MHICVSKQNIVSNNGLSPGRHQAIIWTNAGILLIRPLGTNFSEISIAILTFSLMKMLLKVSSAKWRQFCLGLNVLKKVKSLRCHSPPPPPLHQFCSMWLIQEDVWHSSLHNYDSITPRNACCKCLQWPLKQWGRDKMVAFSQTTLSNAFSWMKILEFRLKFHWSLFLRVLLTIFRHWFW